MTAADPPRGTAGAYRSRYALRVKARHLDALALAADHPAAVRIGERLTHTATAVTVGLAPTRTLAAAGLVTIDHDARLVHLTDYGTETLATRRWSPGCWQIARWSAEIDGLDHPRDQWTADAAAAIAAGRPDLVPPSPVRYRGWTADRLARIRSTLIDAGDLTVTPTAEAGQ